MEGETYRGIPLVDVWLLAQIVFLIIWVCTIFLGLSFLWPFLVKGAAWTPTPRETVRKMLELAKVSREDTVIDLGSGDGRIVIMAAKEFGAAAIGIEVDPLRIAWSRWKVRRSILQDKVQVVRGNFFTQDLSDATVVTVFQRTGTNRRLKTKLTSELKPGTRIVSYMHPFDGWTPAETDDVFDVFLYIM